MSQACTPDRRQSAVIAATNNEWPPSTPRRGGTLNSPISISERLQSPYATPWETLRPTPHPGLGHNGITLNVSDDTDSESGWVTDDEEPHPRPSRGRDDPEDDFWGGPRIWHC